MATIGPATEREEVIGQLIELGVDFFRFNLKHNTVEWHQKVIGVIRKCCQNKGKKLGIIADIQGPELRVETPQPEGLEVKEGDIVKISESPMEGKSLVINLPGIIKQIAKGDEAYIDNGNLHLVFEEKTDQVIKARVEIDYFIKNKKAINIPGINLELPLFSKRDEEVLGQLEKMDVDYLALSFVRSKDDIKRLREIVKEKGLNIGIMAKIENGSAIRNLTEIVDASDAIMIARGDLGVEVPIRQLAFWQKTIIQLCRQRNTPVVVATQMLISMVSSSHPSRAEATDVANAVYDSSDALMLSEETAIGKYPIKTVEEMDKICVFVEEFGKIPPLRDELEDSAEVICDAAARMVAESKLPIKAIVVFTQSGQTARVMSRYRLKIPIVAVTGNPTSYNQLNISYGVIPFYKELGDTEFNKDDPIFKEIRSLNIATPGDQIIVIHGNNWLASGSTSDLSIIKL